MDADPTAVPKKHRVSRNSVKLIVIVTAIIAIWAFRCCLILEQSGAKLPDASTNRVTRTTSRVGVLYLTPSNSVALTLLKTVVAFPCTVIAGAGLCFLVKLIPFRPSAESEARRLRWSLHKDKVILYVLLFFTLSMFLMSGLGYWNVFRHSTSSLDLMKGNIVPNNVFGHVIYIKPVDTAKLMDCRKSIVFGCFGVLICGWQVRKVMAASR